jgi:hypothetical protein
MEATLNGKTLTLTFILSDHPELSESKKNFNMATTNGFTPIPGTDLRVSVNVIKSARTK